MIEIEALHVWPRSRDACPIRVRVDQDRRRLRFERAPYLSPWASIRFPSATADRKAPRLGGPTWQARRAGPGPRVCGALSRKSTKPEPQQRVTLQHQSISTKVHISRVCCAHRLKG